MNSLFLSLFSLLSLPLSSLFISLSHSIFLSRYCSSSGFDKGVSHGNLWLWVRLQSRLLFFIISYLLACSDSFISCFHRILLSDTHKAHQTLCGPHHPRHSSWRVLWPSRSQWRGLLTLILHFLNRARLLPLCVVRMHAYHVLNLMCMTARVDRVRPRRSR